MAILVACFFGSTCHTMLDRKVPILDGLIGAITGIMGGFFFCLLGFKVAVLGAAALMDTPPLLDMKEWWSVGFVVAFFANYLLGGMKAYGENGGGKTIIQAAVSLLAGWLKGIASRLDSVSNQKPLE